ncbi:Fungal Zn(2)-Cys(6) binuclear cluster domain-containing protein [Penicillium ucsense]|uniref:Fungal Zn(2)-Cys(6) binuclear cluster domain-containing protein n=1 Tax=Penicillium ucsense TaxID=2839758 RepID=A0A8J8WFK0_9EURO|nr:Fungal Zn(2)-Cys(6) binuclear cluster domain-containing protein [Penicillium ucsense]KAF7730115.1 Fungal Zn(2)-Cys(6) binuclear cluster domain-containing protein [Penicillium ucsense]
MPRKPTPPGKQRVRTGCLTCRKRRRKCDEQKPRCANCEVKGFPCKYGTDVAFVPPRSTTAGVTTGQVYGSITFVDDSPATHAATKGKTQQHDSDHSRRQSLASTAEPVIGHVEGTRTAARAAIQQHVPETRTMLNLHDMLTPDVPLEPHRSVTHHQSAPPTDSPPSHDNRGSLGHASQMPLRALLTQRTTTLSVTNHETDLLRHFRYQICPWLDVGDPEGALGIQALLLSRTNRPLQAAVLALSSNQRVLTAMPTQIEDHDNSVQFRSEAEETLAFEPELARSAGRTLLLFQDLLQYGIQQWRDLLAAQFENFSFSLHPIVMQDELGEAIFWFQFRLDLAVSVLTAKRPLMQFRSYINRDGSPIQTPRPAIQSPSISQVYKHSLSLLGHCLSLIYGGPDPSHPQSAAPSEFYAFTSLPQSRFLSQWTFLWSDCQRWYNERPVDAQQIVDVRGGEADKIDPSRDSALPILIYTTPMALVANVVYHITSLLLLGYKPRLLKALPGPRCFTSHIWHAQSIAGIAVSNESSEQWDPVLIASLLLVARDMTHQSQQAVLMETFRRITASTGINLNHEIEALQAGWKIARFDEDTDEMDG